MRNLWIVALLVACGSDDELTADNANDVITCDAGYVANGMAVTECERACATPPPLVEVPPPGCQDQQLIVEVEGVVGFCDFTGSGAQTKIVWVPCDQ